MVPDADSWSARASRQAVRYAPGQQPYRSSPPPSPTCATANSPPRPPTRRKPATPPATGPAAYPLDKHAAIRQAIQTSSQLEDQQRALPDQTRKTGYSSTAVPELERQQARLADRTAQLREDLQTIAPAPAAALQDATYHMENAQPRHHSKRQTAALLNQRNALAKLATARDELQKQLPEPDQPPATPAATSRT